MEPTAQPGHGAPQRGLAVALGLMAAIGASLHSIRSIASVLRECDIGINAAANSLGLVFFVLPAEALTLSVVFGFAFPLVITRVRRLRGSGPVHALIAVPALVILVIVVGWVATMVATSAYIPAGYDDHFRIFCPDIAPPWRLRFS